MARRKALPPGVEPREARDGTITYRVRWYDKRGKRHSLTFDSPTAAGDHLVEMRRIKRMGGSADPSGQAVLFKDWYEKWAAGRLTRGSTRKRDVSHFNHRILPEWGDVRLGDIETEDINVWVVEMIEGGDLPPLGAETAAKHLSLFSQCLADAVPKLISVNPAASARRPKIIKKEARFLLLDELVALEDAMTPWWRPTIAFMADIGPRIGETGAVRVSDVDFLTLEVKIRETVTYEEGGRTIGPTKTPKGYRIVPFLTDDTAEMLARMIRDRGLGPRDLLFTGPKGGGFDPKNWRNRHFADAVEKAGLEEPLPTPHALRHTAISRWIAAGNTDLKRLADAAGHESVTTFFDRYGHLLPYDAKPTRDALGEQKRQARKRAPRGGDDNVVELGVDRREEDLG